MRSVVLLYMLFTSNEANVEEISEREMLFVSVEIFIGGSFGKGNA